MNLKIKLLPLKISMAKMGENNQITIKKEKLINEVKKYI